MKPNFLHRDLPDISVKVMYLYEGAADRKRHLSPVADYQVVTNAFPAARGQTATSAAQIATSDRRTSRRYLGWASVRECHPSVCADYRRSR